MMNEHSAATKRVGRSRWRRSAQPVRGGRRPKAPKPRQTPMGALQHQTVGRVSQTSACVAAAQLTCTADLAENCRTWQNTTY